MSDDAAGPSVPPAMKCSTLGLTPIASPTSLPPGFETTGGYLHQQLTGQAPTFRLAPFKDNDD